MPNRIQRSRSRGWRMPEGAIYVGRPTGASAPRRAAKALLCSLLILAVAGIGSLIFGAYQGWGDRLVGIVTGIWVYAIFWEPEG